MDLVHFTPGSALFGGVLIGASASILLALNGRVAGISGLLGGLVAPKSGEVAWRAVFLLGLVVGGLLMLPVAAESIQPSPRTLPLVVLAGLFVGVGTRLGNGCTSGHGVCGISRLSPRSLVATATFMATGVLTATVVRWLVGGV